MVGQVLQNIGFSLKILHHFPPFFIITMRCEIHYCVSRETLVVTFRRRVSRETWIVIFHRRVSRETLAVAFHRRVSRETLARELKNNAATAILNEKTKHHEEKRRHSP